MQNVGSGNGVDMGRKLQQLDLGSLGALPAMDMSDMGQNAMQNTLQVRAVSNPPFLEPKILLRGTLATTCLDAVLHLFDVVDVPSNMRCCSFVLLVLVAETL